MVVSTSFSYKGDCSAGGGLVRETGAVDNTTNGEWNERVWLVLAAIERESERECLESERSAEDIVVVVVVRHVECDGMKVGKKPGCWTRRLIWEDRCEYRSWDDLGCPQNCWGWGPL